MLRQIRAIISDMDGVLWRGNEPLPGLQAFFDWLDAAQMDFVLATNNSSRAPRSYVEKLATMGIYGVAPQQILTSGSVTVSRLQADYPDGADVYVVGGAGLVQQLRQAGFRLVESGAQVVVCGIDFELSYSKLKRATLLVRRGARFIGTNPDASFPAPEGLVPGAGSILALLEVATGSAPTVMGKPARAMFDVALQRLQTSPSETLMIGDRISTDIAGAQALGIQTALVMTGVETAQSLRASAVAPDAVFAGLPELLAALR